MSDDDSLGSAGDDDVQVAAQISSMLKPLTKKQSKMALGQRQLDAVDADAMGAGSGGGGVPIRLPSVDEFKRRALTNSSGSTVLEPARAILDATGTGELREFAPMPPPGRPSPPGRPRSREHSFAD